VINHTGSQTS